MDAAGSSNDAAAALLRAAAALPVAGVDRSAAAPWTTVLGALGRFTYFVVRAFNYGLYSLASIVLKSAYTIIRILVDILSIILTPVILPLRLLVFAPISYIFGTIASLSALWYFLTSAIVFGMIAAFVVYGCTDLFAIRLAIRQKRKLEDQQPTITFDSRDSLDTTASILRPAMRNARRHSDTFDDVDEFPKERPSTPPEEINRVPSLFLHPSPSMVQRKDSNSSAASADDPDETAQSDSSARSSGTGKRVTWALDEPKRDRERSASPASSSGGGPGRTRRFQTNAAGVTRRRKR